MNLSALKAKAKKWLRYAAVIAVAYLIVIVPSIVGWEGVRDHVFALFPSDVEVSQVISRPTTIDGLIEERAQSWLKGPEAFEYAKEKVTDEVIRELSKL